MFSGEILPCFTVQDVFYTDNGKVGERRRVNASCMVDGYTDVAGGLQFRKKNGERMRFKVLHKVYDFRKSFGYDMCVGCGHCDTVCPDSQQGAVFQGGSARPYGKEEPENGRGLHEVGRSRYGEEDHHQRIRVSR